MSGPGAIGPATPTLPPDYAETYDLNRDGVVTPEEVQRRDLAGALDSASLFPFSHAGPPLLHLDAGWTPQGQGYDTGRHELLTTYYADTNGNDLGDTVRLSVQDRYTGVEARDVVLLGSDKAEYAAHGNPTHGGGVATDGEFVYVADTTEVYVYRRSAIDNPVWNPATGRYEVEAAHVIEMPEVPEELRGDGGLVSDEDGRSIASYITVHDGKAYVGSYSKNGDGMNGAVYRFDIDPGTGQFTNPTGPVKAPDQAQGVTVVDGGNGLLFSSNNEDYSLVYQPVTNDGDAFVASYGDRKILDDSQLIDGYVEEINVIDGELWVTYESGAKGADGEYKFDVDDRHRSIQRIPIEDIPGFPG